MSDKAKFYEEEIAPKLLEMADACYERGMSFVTGVSLGEEEGMATIGRLTEDAKIGIKALAMLSRTTPNIDQFVFSLIVHCNENNIDIGSSIFLSKCASFMEGE